jgi:hypothetical protein
VRSTPELPGSKTLTAMTSGKKMLTMLQVLLYLLLDTH